MALDVDTSAAPSDAGRVHPRSWLRAHGRAGPPSRPDTGDVSVSGLAGIRSGKRAFLPMPSGPAKLAPLPRQAKTAPDSEESGAVFVARTAKGADAPARRLRAALMNQPCGSMVSFERF